MTDHTDDLAALRRRVANLGGPDAAAEFTLLIDTLHEAALDNTQRAHQEELTELGARVAQLEADVGAIARALGLTSPP